MEPKSKRGPGRPRAHQARLEAEYGKPFAQLLWEFRFQEGLTVKQIAERTGASPSRVGEWLAELGYQRLGALPTPDPPPLAAGRPGGAASTAMGEKKPAGVEPNRPPRAFLASPLSAGGDT